MAVYIRFISLGTQLFIAIFFVTPVTCTNNLKFLKNVFKKQNLDVPTLQLKKFSNSSGYNCVSVRYEKNFCRKDRKSFQKQVGD